MTLQNKQVKAKLLKIKCTRYSVEQQAKFVFFVLTKFGQKKKIYYKLTTCNKLYTDTLI